jgi:hypothetical protein
VVIEWNCLLLDLNDFNCFEFDDSFYCDFKLLALEL